MPTRFGKVKWPGITDFDSCSYTLSQGISVGYASLIVSPTQAEKAHEFGDLVLEDGINKPIVLKDCKIGDVTAVTLNGGARGVQLHILDGRWKWAFGSIDGWYNKRDEHNKIELWTARALKDMIQDCVLEMVGDIPLSNLLDPNDEHVPFVDWSSANPSRSLADLVEPFGAIPIWRPNAKQRGEPEILIAIKGEGRELPTGSFREWSPGVDVPEKPSDFSVVTAPVVYQVVIPIAEAVGDEPGGETKLIGDLSYKPTAGWGGTIPPYFQNVSIPGALGAAIGPPGLIRAPLDRPGYEALAKNCIYRKYRMVCKAVDGGKLVVPGYGEIEDLNQLVPVQGLIGKEVDKTGNPIVDPPQVYGIFHRGEVSFTPQTSPIRFEGSFTIDAEKHTVVFDQYLYKVNPSAAAITASMLGGSLTPPPLGSQEIAPAELVLICSVMIRDEKTHQIYREAITDHTNTDANTKAYISIREDIRPVFTAEYDPTQRFKKVDEDDNIDEVQKQADYYLKQIQKQFETATSEEKEYPGLMPEDLDGAISQITWTVGGGGVCTTRISRNTEHAYWQPNYIKRRGAERLKAFFDAKRPRSAPFNPLLGG